MPLDTDCSSCQYKNSNDKEGFCYMWREAPLDKCLQHTNLPKIKHSPTMLKLTMMMAMSIATTGGIEFPPRSV